MSGSFSIKGRILLTFSILSVSAIYYFSDWASNSSRRHYLEAAEELMVDQLCILKSFILNATEEDNSVPDIAALKDVFDTVSETENPEAKIYRLVKKDTDVWCYVTDRHGRVLYHSRTPEFEDLSFAAWNNVLRALQGKYGARSTRTDEEDPTTSILHVSFPLIKKGQLIGTVTLVKPVKRLSLFLVLSRNKIMRAGGITLLLILLLGLLLMRRIVNPIEELTDYARELRDGKRSSLPALPQGELQLLGKTIDEMCSQLDGKSYVESYVQTLTHELKSPIAAIQGAVELLESPGSEQQKEKLLNNISRESGRMAAMVQKLLLLSRIEHQEEERSFSPIDLAPLIKRVVDNTVERYPQIRITLAEADDCTITGDAMLLETAFSNLLINACDFSLAGKEVIVKLKASLREITFEVIDEGEGIPQYALERVFERFYSLPRPQNGAKSSGLGLAIVREIATIHRGNVNLENNKERGVTATLILPV